MALISLFVSRWARLGAVGGVMIAPIEHNVNVGSIAADAQYCSQVFDLGDRSERRVTLIVVTTKCNESMADVAISAYGSDQSASFCMDPDNWKYCAHASEADMGAWVKTFDSDTRRVLQCRPVGRYFQVVIDNNAVEKTGFDMKVYMYSGV